MQNNIQPQTAAELAGHTWLHDGKMIQVTEVNTKTLHIATKANGGYRFESMEDLEYFASECRAVNENTAVMMVNSSGDDLMLKLLDGLVSDFEKLETDPDYIGQAKQRSNHVNTAINLAKLRLQMNGKRKTPPSLSGEKGQ